MLENLLQVVRVSGRLSTLWSSQRHFKISLLITLRLLPVWAKWKTNTLKITAGIFLQSSFILHTLVSEIRSLHHFFFLLQNVSAYSWICRFSQTQMVRVQTRRNSCCGINLHHIQPSERPALFHALWISQSLKLCSQPYNNLRVFLILSIVYAEILPKIHTSEPYSSIILIDYRLAVLV